MKGKGLYESIQKAVTARPPGYSGVDSVLKQHGTSTITSLQVGRSPVSGFLTGALNAVSSNALLNLQKEKGFDSIYHTFILIRTSDGFFTRFEKNEIVSFSKPTAMKAGTELRQCPNPQCDLGNFVRRSMSAMGSRFFEYNAFTNNCQIFVVSCLKANGVLTNDLTKFLFQDFSSLSGSTADKAASSVTDIAGAARWLTGGDIDRDYTSGTSNIQLEALMRGTKGFMGVFSVDKLPIKKKNDKSIIINFEPAIESGSHWVCVWFGKTMTVYIDSFGCDPPTEINLWMQRNSKNPIVHQSSQLQEIKSTRCGLFCVYCLKHLSEGESIYDVLYSFKQKPCKFNEDMVLKFAKQLVTS